MRVVPFTRWMVQLVRIDMFFVKKEHEIVPFGLLLRTDALL